MNKLLVLSQYKLRVQWSMAIWYLTIYPLSMLLVYFALIKTGVISQQEGSLMYRLWGSSIFLFAISIRFREDFDFLLTMSVSRNEIFKTHLAPAILFSGLFSALIVIEKAVVDHYNKVFGFVNINDSFHTFAPYSENLLTVFLYFLMLLLACSTTGILLGSLFYRWGQKFVLVFWLIFSAIPVVVLPGIMWGWHRRGQLSDRMSDLGTYLTGFNVPVATVILLLLAVVMSVATWFSIKRLSQK